MRADNSHHLVAAAQRRRFDSLARVEAVLGDLERDGGPTSVSAIATRTDVSRTFLYDPAQAHLLHRLRAIAADTTRSTRKPLPVQQRISTASHEQLVQALRNRNKRLSEENAQLRSSLGTALGQLRDLRRAQRHPSTDGA